MWNGSFEKMNFDEATFLCGSGGKISSAKAIFYTSSHPLERLVSISGPDRMYISNSLPFILKRSNLNLRKDYYKYVHDLSTISKGIDSYVPAIPLNKGRLDIHYCTKLTLSHDDLALVKDMRVSEEAFSSYEDYIYRVNSALSSIVENAVSAERNNPIKNCVSQISTGYDSVACTSVARSHGCETAVTLNAPQKYAEDSGKDIAEILGYENIITGNAEFYMHLDNKCIEPEYLSSGELGTDIVFSAFEEHYRDSLVVRGIRGDKIWDKNWPPNDTLRFENEIYAGTSSIENRLRVGYSIIPLPFFGADQWVSIHKISNDMEMADYSVGGTYDRPIPRRIAEEMGVPREMFGRTKKGAGFNYNFYSMGYIKSRMSPESFRSFKNFKQARGFSSYVGFLNFVWLNKGVYINYILGKLGTSFRVRSQPNFSSNPFIGEKLFQWSISIVKDRY